MSLWDHGPDVEVLFTFNHQRKLPVRSHYRPDHLILDNDLTCGAHRYYDDDNFLVYPGEQALGTVTFINPQAYPNSLWVGRVITFQEGAHITGTITITKILNPLLQRI
jgi:hypothetical protein